jgi:hypothetical protein
MGSVKGPSQCEEGVGVRRHRFRAGWCQLSHGEVSDEEDGEPRRCAREVAAQGGGGATLEAELGMRGGGLTSCRMLGDPSHPGGTVAIAGAVRGIIPTLRGS